MHFMNYAIQSAKEGVEKGDGGPFGACIVFEGEVIAVSHNTVIKDKDPTCHAEMNAIRLATKTLNNHVLTGCELYTTAEPCPMCLSAIYWACIDKVYMGADREVAARFGFRDEMLYVQMQCEPEKRIIPCIPHIMSEDCEAIFHLWKELEAPLY
jgi:guanine deaminase